MNKLFRLVGAGIGVFLLASILASPTPVHAITSTYTGVCPTGSDHTQAPFADGVIVGCTGGKDISIDKTKGTTFGISVTCSTASGTLSSDADSPSRFVFACNGHAETPIVTFSNGDPAAVSGSSGAAFQGNCGNDGGGVKVGVTLGGKDCVGGDGQNPIYAYLRGIIQFAGGIFGLLTILMIIVSGIQYITSSGNPTAVAAAKKRLVNAILGIILFMIMFAVLNYLIPGGIL